MSNLYVIAEINIREKLKKVCLAYRDDELIDILVLKDDGFIIGDIYAGMVSSVQGQGEALFVDISPNMTGYVKALKQTDYVYVKKVTNKPYPAPGDIILVQYKTEAIKSKQPGFTAELSLPGKYCVVNSKKGSISISKKLDNEKREAIKEASTGYISDDYGLLFRTAAAEADWSLIEEEIKSNTSICQDILSRVTTYPPYTKVYKSKSEYIQWLEELYVTEKDRIVTNIPEIYEELKDIYPKTENYKDSYPIEKLYSLTTVFDRLFAKTFHLKSGGTIVIEQTESLTAIDVNTAGCTFNKNKSKLDIFIKINREAAEEIIRQIVLRGLSGIIIVDFIDMPDEKYNVELLNTMRKLAKEDRVGTSVVDITPLGLIEITRKKVRASLKEQIL